MVPTRVQFDGVAGEYDVLTLACAKMDCSCGEVSFELRPVGHAERPPLVIVVDAASWEEVDAPRRAPRDARVVQEFITDYPASERAQLLAYFRDKRRISEQVRRYVLPADMGVDGEMVRFADVVDPDGEREPSDYLIVSWELQLPDGRFYMVMDSYCVNPLCDCRKVTLDFYDVTERVTHPDDGPAELAFAARILLDGSAEIFHVRKGTREEASEVLEAWWATSPGHMDDLRWRYDRMREIGERSGRGRRVSSRAVSEQTPSRNEPCPCGSGRKYKNCCGK